MSTQQWQRLRTEAQEIARNEPDMTALVQQLVLSHDNLAEAVIGRVAARLENAAVTGENMTRNYRALLKEQPELENVFVADLEAVLERDPACTRLIEPFLYFKGFVAIEGYRLAHSMWTKGRKDFALMMQHRIATALNIDIHPAARIGKGLMLDHGSGFVCGETVVIEDNVSIMHSVTLGGSSTVKGSDRHPKIRHGVLIGAGAKVLGNIEVGACSRIGSSSVVLSDVPPCKTVAGVPARIVGDAGCTEPSRKMDHNFGFDFQI